jgi:hypothetical protein
MRRNENCVQTLVGKCEVRDHLEELDMDGDNNKITLKKYDWSVG